MFLAPWFIHTVTMARLSTSPNTGKGDPTYAAQTTIAARVEKVRKRVTRADGVEVMSTHVFATDVECRTSDRFWFPSIAGEAADDVTVAARGRRPLQVVVATDKLGLQSLWQVYF